uniref:Uncharacterized protein n=1 Tax=Candidatus Kentrum sp. LPFa TaxID=2126335 RepID=A0A450WK87_9GAMM|nr:MAG: hypothetical protein BECKLPF1236B_GA0070989_111719 [Candidatus Kentron sp. LPFa]
MALLSQISRLIGILSCKGLELEEQDHYETPRLEDAAEVVRAMAVLRGMDGLTPGQIKGVLRAAETMVDALCVLDVGTAEFTRADEVLHRVARKPRREGRGMSEESLARIRGEILGLT